MSRLTRFFSYFILFIICLISSAAQAQNHRDFFNKVSSVRNAPVKSDARVMGKVLFRRAKRFAEANSIPYYTETMRNGQKRIVMNVHGSENLQKYVNAFSEKKGILENFFNASNSSKPNWSYHRIGSKLWREYGSGETYRTGIYSSSKRLAFPYLVKHHELKAHKKALQETANPPFDHNPPHMGGILSGTYKRNCTDWITAYTGKFMGMRPTNAVVSHAGQLYDGSVGQRMTVKTVITSEKITDFKPENRSW